MSDPRTVQIEIYGEITTFAAVSALAAQMSDYVSPDYGEGRFEDEYSAIEFIFQSIDDGVAIKCVREETGEDLDPIAAVCRQFGLPYKIQTDSSMHSGPTLTTWQPGIAVCQPLCDEDFRPVMALEDIRKEFDQGPDIFQSFLQEYERICLANVDPKVVATPEVVEALEAYLAGPDSPTP